MTTVDVGDRVNVRYLAYAAGVPTSATMALVVTAPDGTDSTPAPSFTAANQYDASFVASQIGEWTWTWTASGTIDDVEHGSVVAGNPAPALYASLAELKQALNIPLTDTSKDATVLRKIDGASRSVEQWCDGRQFYLDRVASTRTYSTRRRVTRLDDGTEVLRVDSIGADPDDIVVEVGNGTSWTAATDFETAPDNALARLVAIEGLVSLNCDWSRNRRVRITARWGWPAVPTAVAEATFLQANRLAKRPGSPEGVAGSSEWGIIRLPNLDPDVKALLAHLHTDIQVA